MIDAHTHFSIFSDRLTGVVLNTTDPTQWPALLAAASENQRIFPQFGVHPWFVQDVSEDWPATLEKTLREARRRNLPGVGVGEIGLDSLRAKTEAEWRRQIFCFREQLTLAERENMPVSIHCVRCWDVLMKELKSWRDGTPRESGIVLHAFRAPAETIPKFAEMGCYFSISPDVLRDSENRLRETVRKIPLNRLLVETDFTPEKAEKSLAAKVSGGEIETLLAVLAKIAEIRGMSAETLEAMTEENTKRAFRNF